MKTEKLFFAFFLEILILCRIVVSTKNVTFFYLMSTLGENRDYTISTPQKTTLHKFRSGIIFFVSSLSPFTPSRFFPDVNNLFFTKK